MDPLGLASGFDGDRGPFMTGDAGAIHDLGNLIQIAASAVNRVGRSPCVDADPALAPVLASARAALQQAGLLVRRTVHRARDAAVTVRKVPELQDVATCLSEILALVRWICEPDIRLLVDAPAVLPWVRCSGVDLQNAVLNLAINARDAMPDGGVLSLSVRAIQPQVSPGVVEIRIADNGVGMSPATLQSALHPFFTTKLGGRGAGLGLAMVQRFAQEAGGRVEIASSLGDGTTVVLRLPAAPEPGVACDEEPTAWAVDID
jgi:signal transduction histidine kinase